MTKKTTSRPARRVEPARGAKIATGSVTAIAFVGIVFGLQTAAAADDAAKARMELKGQLAARDVQFVAQAQSKAESQARLAQKVAAKKAADKRAAAAKKAAERIRTLPQPAPRVSSRTVSAAPPAPAARRSAARRPATKVAARKSVAPVDGTSGGSGG